VRQLTEPLILLRGKYTSDKYIVEGEIIWVKWAVTVYETPETLEAAI